MTEVKQSTVYLAVLAVIFLSQCTAFSLSQQRRVVNNIGITIPKGRTSPSSSPLFVGNGLLPRLSSPSGLFMTTEDPNKEPTENEIKAENNSPSEEDGDGGVEEKTSITKTVLLTIPLFCKFVVVLVIKFLTDLVVFPLLFLYRMAGQMKRKFLKLIGKRKINDGEPANGASK